ncbi:hypothetical protein CR513_28937, partial [Mucuna pruriens]
NPIHPLEGEESPNLEGGISHAFIGYTSSNRAANTQKDTMAKEHNPSRPNHLEVPDEEWLRDRSQPKS